MRAACATVPLWHNSATAVQQRPTQKEFSWNHKLRTLFVATCQRDANGIQWLLPVPQCHCQWGRRLGSHPGSGCHMCQWCHSDTATQAGNHTGMYYHRHPGRRITQPPTSEVTGRLRPGRRAASPTESVSALTGSQWHCMAHWPLWPGRAGPEVLHRAAGACCTSTGRAAPAGRGGRDSVQPRWTARRRRAAKLQVQLANSQVLHWQGAINQLALAGGRWDAALSCEHDAHDLPGGVLGLQDVVHLVWLQVEPLVPLRLCGSSGGSGSGGGSGGGSGRWWRWWQRLQWQVVGVQEGDVNTRASVMACRMPMVWVRTHHQ